MNIYPADIRMIRQGLDMVGQKRMSRVKREALDRLAAGLAQIQDVPALQLDSEHKKPDTTHNGWTNYETWATWCWITNESDPFKDEALECLETARTTPSANAKFTGNEPFTIAERAVFSLSKLMKEISEQDLPTCDGFASDLLNASFGEINWFEMAKHIVDDWATEQDKTSKEAIAAVEGGDK